MDTETKLVETTPVTVQPANNPGWQTTAYNEIRNGAWAVLLVGVISYTALRGVVSRYLDKHMALLDTMKDSLGSNAMSLKALAESEQDQVGILKQKGDAIQKQGDALEKLGNAIMSQQSALSSLDQRQKESVAQALSILDSTSTKVSVLLADRESYSGEHKKLSDSIGELKAITLNHQTELLEKLQTIEDLYAAAEEATGNKGKINNFWRR